MIFNMQLFEIFRTQIFQAFSGQASEIEFTFSQKLCRVIQELQAYNFGVWSLNQDVLNYACSEGSSEFGLRNAIDEVQETFNEASLCGSHLK
jgi:hypothetical protein